MRIGPTLLLFCGMLCLCLPCKAQTDSLHLTDGQVFAVRKPKLKQDGGMLRFRGPEDRKLRSVPTTMVSSLVMDDGFTFSFNDGQLLRDNLAQAPRTRYYGFTVSAENFIPLKQPELRQYYGPELYDVESRAQQALMVFGMWEVVFSNLIYWMTDYQNDREVPYYKSEDGTTYSRLELRPEGVVNGAMCVVAFYSGFANCALAFLESALVYSRHDTIRPMNKGWAGAELAGGCSLFLAGLGTMMYGLKDIKTNPDKYEIRIINEDFRIDSALPRFFMTVKDNDDHATRMSTGLLFGGAIAANIGITMALMGGMRLWGWHRVSASTSGPGLAIRF